MCVNTRLVYNRYIRRSIRCDCGKCSACIQQKASYRANRIRNNVRPDEEALFVTLTYKNEYIPYVFMEDLSRQVQNLDIYRQNTCRYIRKSKDYDMCLKEGLPGQCLETYDVKYPEDFDINKFQSIQTKEFYQKNRVGVIYYKDLQNFFKRLRINLDRNYGITEPFTFFACAELGPTTKRPHFHTLIFIKPSYEKAFRNAIVKSWPFADCRRTEKYIEVARDAASYVSSYVNCSSDFPSFFKINEFKQKHSYSHNFGMASSAFNLYSILEKVDKGDMSYIRQIKREGVPSNVVLPIPEYVINRYFPRFKGLSRLAPDKVEQLLLHPSRLREYRFELDYTDEDLHEIQVRLNNCKSYYVDCTGKNVFDYARDFVRVWNCRKSYVLKHSYDDLQPKDFGYFYDNLNEFMLGKVKNWSLSDLCLQDFELNPNNLPWRNLLTIRLTDLYQKMVKQKKVINFCMNALGHPT